MREEGFSFLVLVSSLCGFLRNLGLLQGGPRRV